MKHGCFFVDLFTAYSLASIFKDEGEIKTALTRRGVLSSTSAVDAPWPRGEVTCLLQRRCQSGRTPRRSLGSSPEVFPQECVWRTMSAGNGFDIMNTGTAPPMLAIGCGLHCFLAAGFEGDFTICGLDHSAVIVQELTNRALARRIHIKNETHKGSDRDLTNQSFIPQRCETNTFVKFWREGGNTRVVFSRNGGRRGSATILHALSHLGGRILSSVKFGFSLRKYHSHPYGVHESSMETPQARELLRGHEELREEPRVEIDIRAEGCVVPPPDAPEEIELKQHGEDVNDTPRKSAPLRLERGEGGRQPPADSKRQSELRLALSRGEWKAQRTLKGLTGPPKSTQGLLRTSPTCPVAKRAGWCISCYEWYETMYLWYCYCWAGPFCVPAGCAATRVRQHQSGSQLSWTTSPQMWTTSPQKVKHQQVILTSLRLRMRILEAKRQDVAQWIRNKVSEMVTFQGASRERNMRCRGNQNWPKAPEDDSNRPSSDQMFANDDVRPEMVDRRVDSTEKARRVALGYEDPDLGTNENSATTIRHDSQSRQMIHCCLRGYRLRNRAAPTTLLAGRACRQTRKVDMLQPEEIVKYLVKRYGDKARGPQDRALQLCDARPLTSLERLALEDPLIHCDIGQIAAREIELCPGACVWRGRACTFRCDLYWGHRMDSDVLTYVCVIIASKKMPG